MLMVIAFVNSAGTPRQAHRVTEPVASKSATALEIGVKERILVFTPSRRTGWPIYLCPATPRRHRVDPGTTALRGPPDPTPMAPQSPPRGTDRLRHNPLILRTFRGDRNRKT